MDGVVNLALTFGTLLSSQGTAASFVLTLTGFPPGASLRYFVFRLYQTLSRPIPRRIGVCLPGCWAVPTSRTLADFPGRFIIESSGPTGNGIRHAEIHPGREIVLSWVPQNLRRTVAAEPFRLRGNSKDLTGPHWPRQLERQPRAVQGL
ncbi:hypothetical protein DT019_28640 [Streptomyces sp. SDr-06]|nr:hypothetical protein DT019_28640 [Streptomyces sp. SDr-06]